MQSQLLLLLICAHFGFLVNVDAVQGTIVKCGIFGFSSRRSQSLLLEHLQSSKESLDNSGITLSDSKNGDYTVALHSTQLADKPDSIPSDASVVYATIASIQFNDASILLDLQRAFLTVLAAEEKRTIIIVIDSGASKQSPAQIETAKTAMNQLASEAWILLDKASYRSDDLTKEVNLKIISNSELENKPLLLSELMLSLVSDISDANSRSVDTLFSNRPAVMQAAPSQVQRVQKIELVMDSINGALIAAQEAAQASAAKLQKSECAPEFSMFIENLINAAIMKFHDLVQRESRSVQAGTTSSNLLKIGEQEIKRQIFAMMLPFYRRQVQLARSEVAKIFNGAVGEDMEVTIKLMDDLNAEKKKALRLFASKCAALRPKTAPAVTWSAGYDERQLLDSLDEYIAGREAQAKLVGVLSRGRKPIDVSFHYFAAHPFGRDYRQDVLTASWGKDKPVFDESLLASGDVSVGALRARAMLNQKQKFESHSLLETWKIDRDRELAREMLMFPLSIKNPSVPLSAGRSKKKSSIAAAKVDPSRITFGPERFIRWDMGPLNEAKANIEACLERGEEQDAEEDEDENNSATKIASKLMKKIPGFYQHPPINYGKKFAASTGDN